MCSQTKSAQHHGRPRPASNTRLCCLLFYTLQIILCDIHSLHDSSSLATSQPNRKHLTLQDVTESCDGMSLTCDFTVTLAVQLNILHTHCSHCTTILCGMFHNILCICRTLGMKWGIAMTWGTIGCMTSALLACSQLRTPLGAARYGSQTTVESWVRPSTPTMAVRLAGWLFLLHLHGPPG